MITLRQFLLDGRNGLSRIQTLGAHLGAVHDGVATIQLEGIVQLGQPLAGRTVPRILNPPVSLHEDSRSKVLIGIPPIRWAGSAAASTEDALVHAIKLGPVLAGLEPLGLAFTLVTRGLQPRLDGAVLFVKVAKVRHQILHHVHVREGVDLGGSARVGINVAQASQSVGTVNVHGTRPADTLTARTTECQCGVLLGLDLDESIEDHGTTLIQVDRVCGLYGCLYAVESV